jgi:predicted RNase H-like HicB family nuclease
MPYAIVIEQGPGSFGAYVPDLPGCVAAGQTREEAVALIKEAMDLHLYDLRTKGEPLPEPTSTLEYVEVS